MPSFSPKKGVSSIVYPSVYNVSAIGQDKIRENSRGDKNKSDYSTLY